MFGYEIFWYIVVGLSVVMYVILDGFDLGVGIVHLFVKKDEERRIFLNAIGPVWDGNEVWLVIIGGALFAGFPDAYATLLSSFYVITMAFLFALIMRVVAIEFRSKRPSKKWRAFWDFTFFISSLSIAFGVGLVLGNLAVGIPIDGALSYQGDFATFFRPYPIIMGCTSVFLMAMHGIVFLVMKTEGKLHNRLRKWVNPSILIFTIFYVVLTILTLFWQPHMAEKMAELPYLFALPILAFLCLAYVSRCVTKNKSGVAFISSCLGIAMLIVVYGVGTYPDLIRSSLNPEGSITIFNAASSLVTLRVLTIIVGIGVPLVFAYGVYIYKLFSGKVKLDSHSY